MIGNASGGGPGHAGEPEAPSGARPTLLLVEDDAEIRRALAALFSGRFEVLEAPTGEQAMVIAASRRADVVVADVALPRMDGLALLDALHHSEAAGDPPVVLLSAPAEEALVVDCLEHGAADVVAKPPAHRELVARVERVLRDRGRTRRLEEMAQTDELTGLFNFRALGQRLEEEVQRATRYHHPVSVVMIDLDRLKELNDKLGHSAGNRALAAVGRLLGEDLRQADFAARFGGDEFVVLLPHQAPTDAEVFAERVRTHLRGLRITDERGILEEALTASIGVAGFSGAEGGLSGEALLRAADLALYEAKRRGRNQVAVWGREVAAGEVNPHPQP